MTSPFFPLAARTFGIGFATGLRSMTGPAATFRQGGWGTVLAVAAAGEYIADKLPGVPPRTTPPALAIRIAGGGAAAAAIGRAAGANVLLCALAGAAGAVTAAYAGVAYRARITGPVPSFVAALVEDGVAIAIARAATRSAHNR
jgi:uncharacterized membrane protein